MKIPKYRHDRYLVHYHIQRPEQKRPGMGFYKVAENKGNAKTQRHLYDFSEAMQKVLAAR